ncbi:MAG: M4 family metallopeptidase [Thermodesulfobacteriota bacterium]
MKQTAAQQRAEERILARQAGNRIFWNDAGTVPAFIMGALSPPSSDSAEQIARRFLDDNRDLFAMATGLAEQLEVAGVERDGQGHFHVSLAQYIAGIAVHEGSIQVHIDPAGVVTAYKDNRLAAAPVDMQPRLAAGEAVRLAREDLGADDAAERASRLCLYRDRDKKVHLAWHVELEVAGEHGPRHFFIDATDGALLYRFSENRGVMSRRTYSAGNREVLPGTLVISDEQQSTDAVVQAAHDNAREVYSYYHGTFGRDSYDNKGAPLISTVHFGQSYSNAYWSSSRRQMVYGDGDGIRWLPLAYALDIVGHEFTHAVTSNTARFVYAEQSGALDEAFADFFGVMITNDEEIVDWQMGEGVYTPLRSGDALRDLSDPPRFGLPDHMDDFIPLRAGEQPDPDKNDMGWLHYNCGIPAKAAYLAVAGGEHHGIRVKGIGRRKAEQIFYLAMTEYLRSATLSRWTFEQARFATLNACRQLYGDRGEEYATIKNAWAAVGIGEPATGFSLVTHEAAPQLAIPDNDPAGVTSVLTVAANGVIREIRVFVLVHHSYVNDLRVRLCSPAGEEVVLHDRSGGAADDLVEEYTTATTPGLGRFVGAAASGEWRLVVSDHARVDTGTLERWELALAVEELTSRTLTAEEVVEEPIPDNDPAGITSALTMAAAGPILHLDVTVDIAHTWVGDLVITLVSPAAREIVLHKRAGGSRHDLKKTYSSKDGGELAPLINTDPAGVWRLRVVDLAGQDSGVLHRWSMTAICAGS